MPRTKEFDPAKALERAKQTFWRHGYEATSMNELLKAMGINRASFYDTFESKHDLLLRALCDYDENDRAASMRQIMAAHRPREAILEIFRSEIDQSRGSHARFGCFLINAAQELAPSDPQVAQIVQRGFADISQLFTDLIIDGQKTGDIPKHLDPDQYGPALLNQLVGLLVLVRARAPRTTFSAVILTVEQMLK